MRVGYERNREQQAFRKPAAERLHSRLSRIGSHCTLILQIVDFCSSDASQIRRANAVRQARVADLPPARPERG